MPKDKKLQSFQVDLIDLYREHPVELTGDLRVGYNSLQPIPYNEYLSLIYHKAENKERFSKDEIELFINDLYKVFRNLQISTGVIDNTYEKALDMPKEYQHNNEAFKANHEIAKKNGIGFLADIIVTLEDYPAGNDECMDKLLKIFKDEQKSAHTQIQKDMKRSNFFIESNNGNIAFISNSDGSEVHTNKEGKINKIILPENFKFEQDDKLPDAMIRFIWHKYLNNNDYSPNELEQKAKELFNQLFEIKDGEIISKEYPSSKIEIEKDPALNDLVKLDSNTYIKERNNYFQNKYNIPIECIKTYLEVSPQMQCTYLSQIPAITRGIPGIKQQYTRIGFKQNQKNEWSVTSENSFERFIELEDGESAYYRNQMSYTIEYIPVKNQKIDIETILPVHIESAKLNMKTADGLELTIPKNISQVHEQKSNKNIVLKLAGALTAAVLFVGSVIALKTAGLATSISTVATFMIGTLAVVGVKTYEVLSNKFKSNNDLDKGQQKQKESQIAVNKNIKADKKPEKKKNEELVIDPPIRNHRSRVKTSKSAKLTMEL